MVDLIAQEELAKTENNQDAHHTNHHKIVSNGTMAVTLAVLLMERFRIALKWHALFKERLAAWNTSQRLEASSHQSQLETISQSSAQDGLMDATCVVLKIKRSPCAQ